MAKVDKEDDRIMKEDITKIAAKMQKTQEQDSSFATLRFIAAIPLVPILSIGQARQSSLAPRRSQSQWSGESLPPTQGFGATSPSSLWRTRRRDRRGARPKPICLRFPLFHQNPREIFPRISAYFRILPHISALPKPRACPQPRTQKLADRQAQSDPVKVSQTILLEIGVRHRRRLPPSPERYGGQEGAPCESPHKNIC